MRRKIRMAEEDDAEHVVDFAFHPIRARPDTADAIDLQTGIALSMTSSSRQSFPLWFPARDEEDFSTADVVRCA